MKKEWEFLGQALAEPERPYVAVSGGAKVSSKLGVIQSLLEHVDGLIIGGAMANTFLLTMGHAVGASLAEADLVGEARAVMDEAEKRGVELSLPVDVTCGKGLDDAAPLGVYGVDAVPDDAMILDIGPETAKAYAKALAGARTVMWNGPMGAFENPAFADGSKAVAEAIARLPDALTVVGGGDTDAVVHAAGLDGRFSFISTGGGSFLEFLEGKELPAFTALKECSA